MLTQLPTGNWIETKNVVSVIALPKCDVYIDRVVVHSDNAPCQVVEFENFHSAEEYRDKFAVFCRDN